MKLLRRHLFPALLVPVVALSSACSSLNTTSSWEPVYGEPSQTATHPAGTWQANRQHVYAATTLGTARDRFRDFINDPANYTDGVIGSLEDGPHLYAMESAKYELVRLHYLLDGTADGDVIFKELDPLDVLP